MRFLMLGRKVFFRRFAPRKPSEDETAAGEILQVRIARIRERQTVRDWHLNSVSSGTLAAGAGEDVDGSGQAVHHPKPVDGLDSA